jgi:hypothetical protein
MTSGFNLSGVIVGFSGKIPVVNGRDLDASLLRPKGCGFCYGGPRERARRRLSWWRRSLRF